MADFTETVHLTRVFYLIMRYRRGNNNRAYVYTNKSSRPFRKFGRNKRWQPATVQCVIDFDVTHRRIAISEIFATCAQLLSSLTTSVKVKSIEVRSLAAAGVVGTLGVSLYHPEANFFDCDAFVSRPVPSTLTISTSSGLAKAGLLRKMSVSEMLAAVDRGIEIKMSASHCITLSIAVHFVYLMRKTSFVATQSATAWQTPDVSNSALPVAIEARNTVALSQMLSAPQGLPARRR